MADKKTEPDAFYFRSLTLANARSFGVEQVLNLVDSATGHPSKWSLILGENGVGKTTIMQSLAMMRPIASFPSNEPIQKSGQQASVPTVTCAELSIHEDADIYRLVRLNSGTPTRIKSALQAADGTIVEVGVTCAGNATELTTADFDEAKYKLGGDGPLIIGYGAARHVGHRNIEAVGARHPTDPLFRDAIDLFDAEELLDKMQYASLQGPRKQRDRKRLNTLKIAIAALIPGIKATDIEVRGARVPGRSAHETGVHVHTSSGTVPLADLSIGYQTVFAWTVDLAWRLFTAYADSVNPLRESAIVLIDEIDLHLHPRWQRTLRRHLTEHFPNVQFVGTTHSPITAQETLSAGGNLAVVHQKEGQSQILNNPLEPMAWRFDQVLTSDLFGFETSRSVDAEDKMSERLRLIRKKKLSEADRARLKVLDDFVDQLPTARTPDEQRFEDRTREVARLVGVKRPRK